MKRSKPSEYFWREVRWPEDEDEPDYTDHDVPSLEAARHAVQKEVEAGRYTAIGRRTNIVDVTPAGDPPGLLWDYENEIIEEP